jgi:hypothetical protein
MQKKDVIFTDAIFSRASVITASEFDFWGVTFNIAHLTMFNL